jgi:DNA-binding NarL/FixJ family response regulator
MVAEDHAMVREGLRSLIEKTPDMRIVAEASTVGAILPGLARTRCDILLLDLHLDRDVRPEIAAISARVAVVVVTADDHVEDALRVIRNGVRAVVFKRFAVSDLLAAIRAVAGGGVWLPPSLQTRLVERLEPQAPGGLTPRERDIVAAVARGLRNAEIGSALGISEETVKKHLSNIFHKVDVRDRVELTLYAVEKGIVAPPSNGR